MTREEMQAIKEIEYSQCQLCENEEKCNCMSVQACKEKRLLCEVE